MQDKICDEYMQKFKRCTNLFHLAAVLIFAVGGAGRRLAREFAFHIKVRVGCIERPG